MSFAGTAVLILAFVAAIYSFAACLLDSRKNKYGFPVTARRGIFIVAGLVTLAELLLLISLLTHNFSLLYVADYSSRETPSIYLVTALWAGDAGSLLFWGWIVALAGAVLLWRSNKNDRELMPAALPVILFTEMLFLILLFVQGPFQSLSPVPADGAGLSPVLQNIGMIFHPPLLLSGYALLVVPAALSISALFNRKFDETWVLTAKRWALAAWLLLGLGNILGMWWAYAELGWGGYWAWDPVENAGLMPWLLITAFLHSGMMYIRRGMFKMWAVVLAVAAFWLSIFGAFLTRSNVAGSVHTFGQTPMTPAFIVFLAISLVGSIWLLIDRRRFIKSADGDDALVSGTGTFLGVNLLLVTSTVFILIGTLLPLLSDIIPSKAYFDIVNLPLFLAIILLAGLCVLVGWKRPDLKKLNRQLIIPGIAGLLVVVALVIAGLTQWWALVPFFILATVFIATALKWGRDVASRMRGRKEGVTAAFGGLFVANRGRYGGYIIHIAILVLALGIVGSSVYQVAPSSISNPNSPTTTVTLDGNKWVTAYFVAQQVNLNVQASGMGSVTPSIGSHSYDYGSSVTVTAIASPGWEFTGWKGDVADTQATTTTITLTDNETLTANFTQTTVSQYTLTINTPDSSMGSITPSTGQYTYATGTVVTLVATPQPGYQFSGWTGDVASANSASTTIIMNSNKSITANFAAAEQYVLTIQVAGSGTVTPGIGSQSYAGGTSVPVNAVADPGWQFTGWTGDVDNVSATNNVITMNSNETLIANFAQISFANQYVLTLGITGKGTVSPALGSQAYSPGSTVTITATPAQGWLFAGWSETALRTGESTTFKGYTVTFEGLTPSATSTQMIVSADLVISRGGHVIAEVHPYQLYSNYYSASSQNWFPKVAINSTPAEDLYISLNGWDTDGLAYFSISVKPLIEWIWIGGLLLLVGGVVSFSAPVLKPSADEDRHQSKR